MLGCGGMKAGSADASVFAPTLDTFVAVLVETTKVLPHFLLPVGYDVSLPHQFKSALEFSNSLSVKFVLMTFQVSQLSELLVAVVELASERLRRGVDDFMCSHIPSLSECLSASIAAIWSFASVSAFMRLEVSKLGEALTTTRLLADLPCVSQIRCVG